MARYSRCFGLPGEARHKILCAISRTPTKASCTLPFLDCCWTRCCFGMLILLLQFFLLILLYARLSTSDCVNALSLLLGTDAAPDVGLGPLPVAEEHQRPDLERPARYRDQGRGGGRYGWQQSNP